MTGPQGMGNLIPNIQIGSGGIGDGDSPYDEAVGTVTSIWYSKLASEDAMAWPSRDDVLLNDLALESKQALFWFNAWFQESGFAPSSYFGAAEELENLEYMVEMGDIFAYTDWPTAFEVLLTDDANETSKGMFWFNAWWEESGNEPTSYYDALQTCGGLIWYVQGGSITSSDTIPMGGVITTTGGYRYHRFISLAWFWTGKISSSSVQVFIIGGGGSGGFSNSGGGGGAGEVIFDTAVSVSDGALCTVGAGGASVTTGVNGNNGQNSTFGSLITALGGGGGGTGSSSGNSGGSGGGGSQGGSGGSGSSGGNSGGAGTTTPINRGGGGGGAGEAGYSGSHANYGKGGDGIEWPPGSGTYWAGGGAGASSGNNAASSGGLGGGGSVSSNFAGVSSPGATNTGSGGAGVRGASASGAGGSGIIIVRYPV